MKNLLLREVKKMNIALICDSEKKEATLQFCKEYENVLRYNKLYIEYNLEEHFKGMFSFIPFETLYDNEEAKQQIVLRILYREIDMLLFFKTTKESKEDKNSDFVLLDVCDENSIPYATNFKTAEILLKSLI